MIAFEVSMSGVRLCTASTGGRGVLSVMVTAAGSPQNLDLGIGGLLDDEHLKWAVPRPPMIGDEITIRIVDATLSDAPDSRDAGARAFGEAQERAYYERLKDKYEPGPRSVTQMRIVEE